MTAIDRVTIIMLGEPVPWARTGTKGGQRFTPAKQRNAGASLRVIAQQEMTGRTWFEGAVRLDIVCEFAIPKGRLKGKHAVAIGDGVTRRPDYDNLAKLASDALNGIVYRDDAQVVDARVRKVYGPQPKIVVDIRPVE